MDWQRLGGIPGIMLSLADSLGMGNDVNEVRGVAFNAKVKALVSVDSRLPNVPCLVVFLRVEGRVAKVSGKERGLFVEGALYQNGCRLIVLAKALAVKKPHLGRVLGFFWGVLRGGVQRFEHRFDRLERPKHATLLKVL